MAVSGGLGGDLKILGVVRERQGAGGGLTGVSGEFEVIRRRWERGGYKVVNFPWNLI